MIGYDKSSMIGYDEVDKLKLNINEVDQKKMSEEKEKNQYSIEEVD